MCDHYDNYFKEKAEPMAKDPNPTQWYQVKEPFIAAVKKLSGHKLTGDKISFTKGSYLHRDLAALNLLDVFCEELPPQVETWKDPLFRSDIRMEITNKARLLIRMQSWADYHNKLDGFVAQWDRLINYGICIENYSYRTTHASFTNIFLFQIAVNSKVRADEMLKYFQKDIQSLIDKNLI